ncbi:hypothetical protein [Geitlerinema sp. P-1104]|nr:hypothetical protein [Geitlerinema sp. P-1104]
MTFKDVLLSIVTERSPQKKDLLSFVKILPSLSAPSREAQVSWPP